MFNTRPFVNSYPSNYGFGTFGMRPTNEIRSNFFYRPTRGVLKQEKKNPFDIIHSKGGYNNISNPAKVLGVGGISSIYPLGLPSGMNPYIKPLR